LRYFRLGSVVNWDTPATAHMYYTCVAKVEDNNRDCCDILKLDHKHETINWLNRVKLTIFGIIVVNRWKAYSKKTFNLNVKGKTIY
jgi:hypothetical protein